MCRRGVNNWLVLLTMEKYMSNFTDRGTDTIDDCKLLDEEDLNAMSIYNTSHRRLLLDGIVLLNNSPQLFACTQPCEVNSSQEYEPDDFEELLNSTDLHDLCRFSGISPNNLEQELSSSDSSESLSTPTTKFSLRPLPSSLSQASSSTSLPPLSSPPPPSYKRKQSELMSPLNELTIVSKEQDVPSLKVKVSFVCVACPSLKFNTASDLKHHILVMNDGTSYGEHKGGPPLILTYKVMPN